MPLIDINWEDDTYLTITEVDRRTSGQTRVVSETDLARWKQIQADYDAMQDELRQLDQQLTNVEWSRGVFIPSSELPRIELCGKPTILGGYRNPCTRTAGHDAGDNPTIHQVV